ncbi:SRPBCC family protein [Nocardia anaemiae]|uniref:SRPBCC family protein n=1 Tax=Nocardia anaemiae TaxID=263910 RepID=UPI0007A55DC4|nr:SRPBCC family protein [Nocardia anaemiae]
MTERFVISVHRNLVVSPEEVWGVTSNSSRFGEWVSNVLEVNAHPGEAKPGDVFTERVRSIGPLVSRPTWTVRTFEPMSSRIDSAEGLAPLRDVINVFRFAPIGDGSATSMTYEFHYDLRPRPFGWLVHRVLSKVMTAEFDNSMRALEALILSERSNAAH